MEIKDYKKAYGTDIKTLHHRYIIDKIIVATMTKDEKLINELIRSLLPIPEAPEKPQEEVRAAQTPEKVKPSSMQTTPQKAIEKPVEENPTFKKTPFSHISDKKFKADKLTGEPFSHLKGGK
ncbi:hypothetical protein HGO21_12480 [Acinetobacter sp. CUI P1]|nr:hypothetical protein [Acinetobacter sp. CUI P1]